LGAGVDFPPLDVVVAEGKVPPGVEDFKGASDICLIVAYDRLFCCNMKHVICRSNEEGWDSAALR
jgi:hypothetical protein